MKSKNSYSGIDPKVANLVKFYANDLKSRKCSADHIEDIEQELFCEFFSCLDQYDETKGSLTTFANQVIKKRICNLIRKQLRTTLNFENNIQPQSHCFEDEAILRIDVTQIISKLPKEWQVLCEQLKHYNIAEVAHMNNMSRTTLHNIIQQMRLIFAHAYKNKCKKN